jgi:riboflavin biosynthesis pyrimidine reductase
VLVGSHTLRASARGTWRPEAVFPGAAAAFAELRALRGRPERPAVAVLTAGGSLDVEHPLLAEGALVLTTAGAAAKLRAIVPPATEVVAVNEGDRVDAALAVAALRERGHAVILSEAGPTTFGQLLAARLVDELFLTLSPIVAGRAEGTRLGLAEGVELLPDTRVETTLLSVRRDDGYLFLRFGLA